MLLSTSLPAVVVHSIFFLSTLTVRTTAAPLDRFPHRAQSLPSQSNHLTASLTSRTSQGTLSVESRSLRLHRRGIPGAVYICTEPNFRGDCSWTSPNDECHIPGTGDNSPQSIGPDERGFCILYEKATCTGNQIDTLRYPGLSSSVPQFGGLKCFADGQGISTSANATSIVQGGGYAGSKIAPAGKNDADPRLSGGVGSAERMKLQEVMAEMEMDGFKQGMIGLKKGHYY